MKRRHDVEVRLLQQLSMNQTEEIAGSVVAVVFLDERAASRAECHAQLRIANQPLEGGFEVINIARNDRAFV